MKLLRRLLAVLLWLPAATASAQEDGQARQTVTISVKNAEVTEVFRLIEKQTDYRFLYNGSLNASTGKITLDFKQARVPALLTEIEKRTQLQFLIRGKDISVTHRGQALPGGQPAAFKREITGIVRDTTGQPMVGVTIAVKDTKRGTGSDANGRFIIPVDDNDVLVFSMISFRKQEIPVAGRDKLEVILHEATSALEEIVIVGFGQQKKSAS